MKITHEICIDHDSTIPGATDAMLQKVLEAIGHDPVNCSFIAATPDAIVNGRIIEILWCDSRILGLDKIGFCDGRVELASAENIDAWFKEQGHRLVKIEGFKALGNTIIRLQITEADEPPTKDCATTFMRPSKSVARDVIAKQLDSLNMNGANK